MPRGTPCLSVVVTLALLLGGATAVVPTQAAPLAGDWSAFGRDPGGSQHSPLTQLTPANVSRLRQVWVHRSGDYVDAPPPRGSTLQVTPLHANGMLYLCTPKNRVLALDPASGRERWAFDPHRADPAGGEAALSPPLAMLRRCRGVAYWQSSIQDGTPCRKRVFLNGDLDRVYAIDADTGRVCANFGASNGHRGFVSHGDYENHGEGFAATATSPPAVLDNLVIAALMVNDGIANAKDGVVRAFDAETGELRWTFNPIPPEFRERSGAANVWSTISVDSARGLVFLPTTSPSTDYYGGGRRFDMPLVNAIVALEGATGRVVWSRQVVRHDLFDYDLVGHPLLIDIVRDGKRVPAAVLQTKMGWLYGFHRETGEPLWPIIDRAVPASDVPGEQAAATQPVPVGMAPFARQTLTRESLFGLTPIDRLACRKAFDALRYEGMYTPPSVRGSILFPSALGGGNWGGAAFDPATNLLLIKAENLATVLRVIPKQDAAREDAIAPQNYLTRPLVGTPYRIEGELFQSPLGLPCTPPPWGTLSAIDLESGKLRWQIPLGQIRRAGVTIPKGAGWGSPNVGGPITTAGGLTFIGATMDARLRAIDTATGRELWSAALPVPGMAVPMSYMAEGRQFVVIAAGGNPLVGTPIGDYLVAFALTD
ncbi:MAG: pyrroloquinoline quinone-dependent dehydrogenase [Steroidobacteraceae bacterium]